MNRKERRRQSKLKRRDRRAGRDAPGGAAAADSFVAAALGQALAFLQAGDPKEAWASYRQVLSVQPDHPEALNLGGVAAFQSGRAKQGLKLVRAALAAQPRYVDAHNSLGNMLKAWGRLDEAEAAY